MTIGQLALKCGIKAAGLVGAGMILYDAHHEGKEQATISSKKYTSKGLMWALNNSRNMSQRSELIKNSKDKIFEWELKHNVRKYVGSVCGYVKGVTRRLFEDIVPLGLSVAAILTKGPSAASKGYGAIASGIALAGYSVYAYTKNVLGLGTK